MDSIQTVSPLAHRWTDENLALFGFYGFAIELETVIYLFLNNFIQLFFDFVM